MMKHGGRLGLLVLVVAVSPTACVAAATAPPARVIVVTGPPPPPIVEEPTPQPRAGSASTTWIAGYWHWTGIQYAWIPGHWEASPRAGASWRAPRYVKSEGSYIYEPGTWWTAPLPTPPSNTGTTANAFR